MLGILNYGVGNIGSLMNMYSCLDIDVRIIEHASEIDDVDKIILPGVGAFDRAMSELHRRDLIVPLNEAVLVKKKPVLGICLGMQLLAKSSEEGETPGLGWIDAEVIKISSGESGLLKVPHIGWSDISLQKSSALFPIESDQRFYFVHSYFMKCTNQIDVLATVSYGDDLCCAVSKNNIYGAQFHPEKSHKFGMNMLANFARL